MVWTGKHHPLLAQPDIIDQVVACYTFSKSYSMSGWRLGYAISSPRIIESIGKMINTSLSCVPPIVQLAGEAALRNDDRERDEVMQRFKKKVELLVHELKSVDGVTVIMPAGTFYVFPNVAPICMKLGITSHGLAMFLLEAADDMRGVACLGGECFGPAGKGFLRLASAPRTGRSPEGSRRVLEGGGDAHRAGGTLSGGASEVSVTVRGDCEVPSCRNPQAHKQNSMNRPYSLPGSGGGLFRAAGRCGLA